MERKRALVTGAAARLGAGMAKALAGKGYDVAVHYAGSAQSAQRTVNDIQAIGQAAVAVQADLLDEAATHALIPQATEMLGGPLSVLVNNASIFEHDTLETATEESWHRHIGSNLRAPFVLSQMFAAQTLKGALDTNGEAISKGLIVNMIDQRVRKLTPDFMTYTLAKAGLWAFTQTAAQALAPDIRVNGIGPGPTLQGGRQDPQAFARQRAATVLRRGSNIEDINAALCYFLDNPAITGQLLCVDGGQHLAWETPDVVGVE